MIGFAGRGVSRVLWPPAIARFSLGQPMDLSLFPGIPAPTKPRRAGKHRHVLK